MTAIRSVPEARQLSGPGIEGLETDPPLYHFDVEPDDLGALVEDPAGFLAAMGLTAEKGVATTGRIDVTLNRFNDRWIPGRGWVLGKDLDKLAPAKGCCYLSDEKVVCHPH
jgi:hypothetical protein